MKNLVSDYHRDGFTHVVGALPKTIIKSLTDLIEVNIDNLAQRLHKNGEISELYQNLDFGRRFFMISSEANLHNAFLRWDSELVSRQLYNLITHRRLLNILGELIGDDIIHNGDFHLRPKMPKSELTVFPWHQDSQFYGELTKFLHIITVHIPLVDTCLTNGCLKFLRGSHLKGYVPRKEHTSLLIEAEFDISDYGEEVSVEASVGDVILFHNLAFHSSGINFSSNIRWTLDLRYRPRLLSQAQLNTEVMNAESWFDKRMKKGWGPIEIRRFNPITSFDNWVKSRNNDILPGGAGKI